MPPVVLLTGAGAGDDRQYQGLLCKQCQYQGLQGATSRVNITCTLLCEWCQYQGLREKQTSRVNITRTLVHER